MEVECQSPSCDGGATVAVHVLSDSSVLIRSDHLTEPFIKDWRCLDCAIGEIAQAFSVVAAS